MPRNAPRPNRIKSLVGQRFGKLVVTEGPLYGESRIRWLCLCECGTEKLLRGGNLQSGNSNSCGCDNRAATARRNFKHGMAHTRIFKIWGGMIARCHGTHKAFKDYGGRGIKVCERWRESFENFYADMSPTYADNLTIERKNNNEGYSKDNCEWITQGRQCANRRSSVIIETKFGKMNISDTARAAGLPPNILRDRIQRHKWPKERWFEPMRQG